MQVRAFERYIPLRQVLIDIEIYKDKLGHSGDRILSRHITMADSAYFVKLTPPRVFSVSSVSFLTLHVYYIAGCSPCSSFLAILMIFNTHMRQVSN